jgi:type IX secretion system PorP/SprF family membrane protein
MKHMKKYPVIIAFAVLTIAKTDAQQLPQYTQYLINDYVINPAIGGTQPFFQAKSNNRYQWTGITDAPRTYVFSLHGPLSNLKMGVGGYVFTDITGPTRRTGARLSYSYLLNLTDDIKMSFGVSGGLLQFAIDGGKITSKEAGDIALSSQVQSVFVPDAGAGFHISCRIN